jgi:hypothetical protein
MYRSLLIALVVTGLGLSVLSCGEEVAIPTRDGIYVGQFEGSESLLSIAVRDDVVIIYVCGDQNHWRKLAGIFSGTMSRIDGTFTVENDLGLENEGVVDGDTITGWVELKNGDIINWTANLVGEDEQAGLYLADTDDAFTGLIVTPDGKANGANYQKECCSSFVAIEEFADGNASVDITANKCGEYGSDAVYRKTLTKVTASTIALRQNNQDRFRFNADPQPWYLDLDGDGYGDDDAIIFACEMPVRGVATAGDCDDDDETVNPGAGNCQ